MILVDTSVWIEADKRKDSPEARELLELVARDDVATTGLVLAELLQGAASEADFHEALSNLGAAQWLDADQGVWIRAGELAFQLRRRGLTTPLSDLVVAAVALEHDAALYAKDTHFDRIPGLRLHRASR